MLNSGNVKIQTRNQTKKIPLMVFLVMYIAVFAGKLPKIIFAGQTVLLSQAIMYGVLGIGGIFIFRHKLIVGLKNWKSSPLKNILWTIGGFMAGILLTNIAAYPAYMVGNDDLMGNSTGALLMVQAIGKPLAILVIGFLGPVTEECVYRAFLIGKGKTKISLWLCVILSSVLFALVHLHRLSVGDFLNVLPGLATGLVYGSVYAITGNITLPIIMHIANNAMGIILLGT